LPLSPVAKALASKLNMCVSIFYSPNIVIEYDTCRTENKIQNPIFGT